MPSVVLGPATEADLLPRSVWRAPLVPAALAVTAGVVLDRYAPIPLGASLSAAALGLLAWLLVSVGARSGLPLVYLGMAGVAVGAAHHHFQRDVQEDDLSRFAPEAAHSWALAQVRGTVDEEPRSKPPGKPDPLRSRPQDEWARTVLAVTHLERDGAWLPVSGRAEVIGSGKWPELHVGDEVEVVGRLSRFGGPLNPGGFDSARFWRDRGVCSRVVIRETSAGVTRLARGWPTSWRGVLAVVRARAQKALEDALGDRPTKGVAVALLLGEEERP